MRRITLSIVFFVIFSVLIISISAVSCKVVALAAPEFSPSSGSSVVLAHLTDTHYYPLNYCDNGNNEDFNKEVIGATKLLVENQIMVEETIANLKNPSLNGQIINLDYILVSGDITLDGEIQSHYEIANMLRELQNTIRITNPNFQIFCSPGNHDLYNPDARSIKEYLQLQGKQLSITRLDYSYLYSGLGQPDFSDEQLDLYYQSIANRILFNNLPFTPFADKYYVRSYNASNLTMYYQRGPIYSLSEDYLPSELSFLAINEEDKVAYFCPDEELSSIERGHVGGGKIFNETIEWLDGIEIPDNFLKIAVMHHNVIPHFSMQDSILKDFTLYRWREMADYLADSGYRYSFTGHMHAHDVVSHISQNGNSITDSQTGSSSGYLGATRIAKIERGTFGQKYAENYSSFLLPLIEADFTRLFDEGYLLSEEQALSFSEPWKYYLDYNNLRVFIEKRGDTYICINCGDYAVQKLFYEIIDSLRLLYLNPEFIGGLGEMVEQLLANISSSINFSALPIAALVDNIIRHIETNALINYEFNPSFEGEFLDIEEGIARGDLGAKLSGKITELAYDIINLKLNNTNVTFFDTIMFAYTGHQIGNEPYNEYLGKPFSEYEKAMEGLKNGDLIRQLMEILLDNKDGLLGTLLPLFSEPINLSYGLDNEEISSLEDLLETLFLVTTGSRTTFDLSQFELYDFLEAIVPKIGNLLPSAPDLLVNLKFEQNALDTISNLINSYVTNSLYTGLGEIAYSIVLSFSSDEYPDGNTSQWTLHPVTPGEAVSFIEGDITFLPSIENGFLPSMLTVNFGKDPKSSKNFTWFTDRRVKGSTIQYVENIVSTQDFHNMNKTEVNGSYQYFATTTPSIDVGVFASLMDIEIGKHTVSLNNLKADTNYSYRVGDSDLDYWSPIFNFKTAPQEDNTPFDVLLMSDLQGYSINTYKNAQKIINNIDTVFPQGYNLVINCGDSVDNSKNIKHWEYLLNGMGSFWPNTSSVNALGNHEEYMYTQPNAEFPSDYLNTSDQTLIWDSEYNYGTWHYNYDPSYQQDPQLLYYSFDYSGVHFTILDTNDPDISKKTGQQYNWLTNDLSQTNKIKVIIMHKGLFSAGSHSEDLDVIKIKNNLAPIFFDMGVSVVFQGHDHTYTESYYLDGEGNILENENQGKSLISGPGVLYITLGTMGDKYYNYISGENNYFEFGDSIHNPTLSNPTFGKLSFDGSKLFYTGYSFDLEKEEAIEVRKIGGLDITSFSVVISAVTAFCFALVIGLKSLKR